MPMSEPGSKASNREEVPEVAAIPSVSTDSEIIERSRQAPGVFAELFDRYGPMLHRYISRRVDSSIADDVLSETFLVAFSRRDSFHSEAGDARPWLFGIATTLLKKHRRLEAQAWRALVAGSVRETDASDASEPDARLDAHRVIGGLAFAIRQMPAGDRDVLLLTAWGDLDYNEIAEALGIPTGTVGSRLNRARRYLRGAMTTGASPDREVRSGRDDVAPNHS